MTSWKQRARSSLPLKSDGTRAGDHEVWELWDPDGSPLPRPLLGSSARLPAADYIVSGPRLQARRKKQAIDLGASVQDGGMFGDLVPVQPRAPRGTAQLCFLSENAFVGVAELDMGGGHVQFQLTGTEAVEECDRELCGADDCCGDTAFALQVFGPVLRGGQRSFVALNKGLGDFAAFEGRGIAFQAETVPTGTERALLLAEHFSSLPAAAVCNAVLCEGVLTLECDEQTVGEEGGAATAERGCIGTVSEAEAEAGLAPHIEEVAMPSRRSILSLEELVSRGGTVLAAGVEDDDW